VVGIWRHADARVRGMKRVQVEPHLSVTGACSAEWVPIKPKTDPAFLYALIHVMLHEAPRERLDLPLPGAAHRLALPGRRARLLPARPGDAQAAGLGPEAHRRAVPHDTPDIDEALEGRFRSTRSRSAPTTRCWPTACWRPTPPSTSWWRTCSPIRPSGRPASATCRGARCASIAQRIPRPRLRRRDDRDRRRHPALPAGGGDAGQDGQQRLGRLRMLLGAHPAGHAGRRAGGAGRHHRHHGAPEPADVARGTTACKPAKTASWTTR
jgi:hypothetical protein